MVTPEKSKLYTMEEFMELIARPENADRLFELINGDISEVVPGSTYNSGIGLLIATAVRPFCREHNFPCYTSGGDGAYRIGSNVVAPDFAYKRTRLSKEYPDPNPPLWVVEVISPTDEPAEIEKKRAFGIDDALDGGDVLPGFKLAVRVIFPKS